MASNRSLPLLILATALTACGDRAADTGAVAEAPAMATGVGSGPVPPAASPGPVAEQSPAAPQPYPGMPGAAAPTAAPAAAAGAVLASEETNWPGIVAEVTEFRRRGNTLTAKVRFRNAGGSGNQEPDVQFDEVYLMDAANARKYEVLRDEKGTAIALNRQGYSKRWYATIEPGQQQTIWIKFPAPPPEVRTITLQLPNTPPFEELAIQDG